MLDIGNHVYTMWIRVSIWVMVYLRGLQHTAHCLLQIYKLVLQPSVTIEGGRNICGSSTSFIGRYNAECDASGVIKPWTIQCMLHQEILSSKSVHLSCVIIYVANFIRSHEFKYR